MNNETNSNTNINNSNTNSIITKPLNLLMNRWSETTSAKQSPSIHQDWIRYIETKGTYRNPASLTNQHRLSLAKHMLELEQTGRTLFHFSVTYRGFQDRTYNEKDITVFFNNFYRKVFLPTLLNTKNICTRYKKSIQPICFCFADEHEQVTGEYTDRLHHHAIVAVHPDTLVSMLALLGENTLCRVKRSQSDNKIMTTHIRQCDPMTMLYSNKMLWKYPDFLMFPDFNIERIAT